MNEPSLLALDFDGVLCNGLREYFQTSKKVYLEIWPQKSSSELEKYAESFYRVRPVVETGWEMPLLLRALVLGKSEEEIFQDWRGIFTQLLVEEKLNSVDLAFKVDNFRDSQIDSNLEEWLSLHQFYPGVSIKIKETLQSGVYIYIITTKEGRFVERLLEKEGITLPPGYLKGKEVKQPKPQTLLNLVQTTGINPEKIWFVEDRLEALKAVQKEEQLKGVKLFLADWGYNLAQMRDDVSKDAQINLLSLKEFRTAFLTWPIKQDVRPSETSR